MSRGGTPAREISFVSLVAYGPNSDSALTMGGYTSETMQGSSQHSSMIFMVSGLTFKSLIHFEFILVCGVRSWSRFICLHISVQFSQHHLLNKLSLAHCMCLLPLLNIN